MLRVNLILDLTLFLAVPEFLEEPENKVMGVEEDVAFKCRAGGRPKPDIQWSINGVPAECKLKSKVKNIIIKTA